MSSVSHSSGSRTGCGRRFLLRLGRKLLWMLLVLWGITIISFVVIHLAPGSPTDMETTLNPLAGEAARRQLDALYGLDKPLHVQYLDWLSREPGDILAGKPAAMMGAGGGMGTARAQYHLRQTCVYLDIRALNKPEVFSNAFSAAFTPEGDVADTDEGRKLRDNVRALMAALNDSLQA